MPTIQEVRRANLRRVIEKNGGAASVARMLGLSGPSHLSQILSGHRPFTEKTARKFEAKLGMPEYSFDQREGEDIPFAGLDMHMLGESARVIAEELKRAHMNLTSERYSRLVRVVYETSMQAGAVDRANVARLIDLMK
jgi:hypothetical protein